MHVKSLKNSVLFKGILGVEQKKHSHLSLLSKIKWKQIFSFSLPYLNICSLFFYFGTKLPKTLNTV